HKLISALRAEGHFVESVHSLQKDGLDNGALYQFAMKNFDLCFTKDFGFVHNVKQARSSGSFKLLRVVIAQQPQDDFVRAFLDAFRATDWKTARHCDDWP